MKQNTILIALVGALIGGGLIYLILNGGRGEYEMGNMMHEDMGPGKDMQMAGMDHSMMMVSSEKEFLAGMIPHHQEAVDTARKVLERGGTTEGVRTLVENIITAQEKEIAEMKQWYQAWYGEEYQDTNTYQPMMRDLSNLSGADIDQQFLEDMIMHHMGAIMMAQSVDAYIEHQEIADLSAAIKETQSAEIRLMKKLLTEL